MASHSGLPFPISKKNIKKHKGKWVAVTKRTNKRGFKTVLASGASWSEAHRKAGSETHHVFLVDPNITSIFDECLKK